MFDATKGKAVRHTALESTSDKIAADIEDIIDDNSLSAEAKQTLLDRIAEVVANRDTVRQFVAGEYSQAKANNGSPAQALGSGSNGTTPQEALQIVLSAPDSEVPAGSKALLRRALVPGDPEHIVVDQNGTPVLITSLQRKLQQVEDERDKAQTLLANEKDESINGSLAQRLKAEVNKTTAIPTDMVKKGDVKTELDKLRPVSTAKQAVRSNHAVVSMTPAELKAAYDAVQAIVS